MTKRHHSHLTSDVFTMSYYISPLATNAKTMQSSLGI